MPGEMVLLPLGVAVARLLLHANAGSDAATLLGDAKDGWTALKKLRNRPRGVDAVGEAIAARLEPRLRPVQTREARQDLEAAAHDAVDLFSALAGDPGAVRSAAERPETFVDFVYDNGGESPEKADEFRSRAGLRCPRGSGSRGVHPAGSFLAAVRHRRAP